jgi:hypothetical protein
MRFKVSIIPMPIPEFKPGFRFSAFDALLLVSGALGSLLFWSRTWWLGLVIAFVVGHFFLFCNVFRISRRLELVWAVVFLLLALFTVVSDRPTWTTTVLLSLAITIVVVGIELRKPSYHGVGWSRINPNLRQRWDASVTCQSDQTE